MSTVKPDLSIVVMPNTIPITNQVFTLFITTEAYMHLKSLEPLSLACIMAMKRGLATPTPLPEDQFGIRGTRPVVVTVFPELYSEAMTVADLAFGGNIRLALGWAISAGLQVSPARTSEGIYNPIGSPEASRPLQHSHLKKPPSQKPSHLVQSKYAESCRGQLL